MGHSGEQRSLEWTLSVKLPPLPSHGCFEYLEFSSLGLGLSEGEDLRAERPTFFFFYSSFFFHLPPQKCILFRGIFWRSGLVFVCGKDFIQRHSGWRRDLGNVDLNRSRSILFSFILIAQFHGLLYMHWLLSIGFFFYLFFCRSRQQYQQILNQWLLVNLKVRLDLFLSQLSQPLKLNGRKLRFSMYKHNWKASSSHQYSRVHIEGMFAVGAIAQSLSLLGCSLV